METPELAVANKFTASGWNAVNAERQWRLRTQNRHSRRPSRGWNAVNAERQWRLRVHEKGREHCPLRLERGERRKAMETPSVPSVVEIGWLGWNAVNAERQWRP